MRAGRLDRKIPITYPNENARLKILEIHTNVKRKMPLAEDVDLSQIAAKTIDYSGAELEDLVLRAARIAFNEQKDNENGISVEMNHFTEALESININPTKRKAKKERYEAIAVKMCDDKNFLQALKEEGTLSASVDRVALIA